MPRWAEPQRHRVVGVQGGYDKLITLCAYAQQGYAFGRVRLYICIFVYLYIYMYVNKKQAV